MSEVEQLHQCVICGRAWDNAQSLRAHMKAHKGEYQRTSMHFKKDSWEAFNKLCKKHKTTTCHVLNTLMEGVVEGAKVKDIDLPKILSPNPVIINMTHVFTGRPRSPWKVDVTRSLAMAPACPRCGSGEIRTWSAVGGEPYEGQCLRCKTHFWVEDLPGAPRPV